MSKLLLFITLVLFTLNGCSTVKKAFDPQRKNSSEEFLVEKKKPLSMPPSFDELPVPKSQQPKDSEQEQVQGDEIQELILDSENIDQNSTNKDLSSVNNLEISILNQINKN